VDAGMPRMNGVGLAQAMAGDPRLASTRVVLMIPLGLPAPVGFAAAVSKPVKPSDLRDALLRVAPGLAQAAVEKPRTAARRDPAWKGPPRGRILIAEDNPVNQKVASLQVRNLGFESDVVANGEEALAALTRLSYSLVLMDCQMPLMDGFTATRELRRRERDGQHTTVIALTANAFASDRQACLEAGMDDFVSKPVSLAELAAVLDRWSGKAAAEPEPAAAG